MIGWLETIALAALMAGLMGGLHCAAMCGGIVCLLNAPSGAAPRARTTWRFPLAYNAGRIASYAVAGALAGTVGQAGLVLRESLPVHQMMMLAAGLTLCLMAMYLAGLSPLMRGLETAGAVLWRQVEPMARRMLPVDSVPKALGLGALWGWMPCGMVYAALLLALSTGHPLDGGLVMLAFGLGTLPNMLLMNALAGRLRQATRLRGVRLAAAGLLAMTGLYGILHAAHPAAIHIAGLFCQVTPASIAP